MQDAFVPFRRSAEKKEAVAGLIALLDDSSKDVRTRALSALSSIEATSPEIAPAAAMLLDDPVVNVQWHAANVLEQFPSEAKPYVGQLRDKMMDDACEIATYSALVLKAIDPELDISKRLIALTKSSIRENRWRAIHALAKHVDDDTLNAVLQDRFQTEADEEIRQMIADALNRT